MPCVHGWVASLHRQPARHRAALPPRTTTQRSGSLCARKKKKQNKTKQKMGCLSRKKKVEPEPEEEETDWVDSSERENQDMEKERRGEHLDKKELEETHKAFSAAASTFGSGNGETLSASKLADGHPESRGNPLARRIFASFSEKKDGTLSKDDWVAACCVLSSRGSKANKARTAFQARLHAV